MFTSVLMIQLCSLCRSRTALFQHTDIYWNIVCTNSIWVGSEGWNQDQWQKQNKQLWTICFL